MGDTKRCSKCEEVKDVAEFSKHKSQKDGLQNRCKACDKAYYEANKNKKKAQQKAYREANKDKIKAYDKVYRKENNDKKKALDATGLCKSKMLFGKLPSVDNPRWEEGFIVVDCKMCGKPMSPTHQRVNTRVRAVTGKEAGESNFYCSDTCKDACPLYHFNSNNIDPRSKLYVEKDEQEQARSCQTDSLKQLQCDNVGYNYCEKCGDIIDVELHHTQEVHAEGMNAVSSAGHMLLCAGCHTELHHGCAA